MSAFWASRRRTRLELQGVGGRITRGPLRLPQPAYELDARSEPDGEEAVARVPRRVELHAPVPGEGPGPVGQGVHGERRRARRGTRSTTWWVSSASSEQIAYTSAASRPHEGREALEQGALAGGVPLEVVRGQAPADVGVAARACRARCRERRAARRRRPREGRAQRVGAQRAQAAPRPSARRGSPSTRAASGRPPPPPRASRPAPGPRAAWPCPRARRRRRAAGPRPRPGAPRAASPRPARTRGRARRTAGARPGSRRKAPGTAVGSSSTPAAASSSRAEATRGLSRTNVGGASRAARARATACVAPRRACQRSASQRGQRARRAHEAHGVLHRVRLGRRALALQAAQDRVHEARPRGAPLRARGRPSPRRRRGRACAGTAAGTRPAAGRRGPPGSSVSSGRLLRRAQDVVQPAPPPQRAEHQLVEQRAVSRVGEARLRSARAPGRSAAPA